jgi:hypothetical protein
MTEDPETIEVPVTRRARVTLVGRLEWRRAYDVIAIATEGGRATLPPDTQFVLRPHAEAPFREGIGRVRDDLRLDIRAIPAASHGDLLYRVEPA